jgi:RimJ/RimL family protein N-acetyltransferase
VIGRVVVTTTRLVVRHRGDDDPFTPGSWHDLAVEHRVELRTLGSLGIRVEPEEPTVEVRVVLDEAARGQGYATEALTAVVDHAFGERGLARVVAFAPSADERTQHLLERVGLRAIAADGDDLVYLRRAQPQPQPPSK